MVNSVKALAYNYY